MKKRFLSLVLVASFVFSLFTFTVQANLENVYTAQYDAEISHNHSEGFTRVSKNGLYGFIDEFGDEVISCTYKYTKDFHEGLVAVHNQSMWGFINKMGNVVVPFNYDDCGDFSEGLASVKKNGKWGYVDTNGELAIPCQYDVAGEFKNGYAIVKISNLYYLINTNGNIILKNGYNGLSAFEYNNQTFLIVQNQGKCGCIDLNENIVIPFQYDELELLKAANGYIFHDTNTSSPSPTAFNVLMAKIEKNRGVIDLNNEIIIPFEYRSIRNVYNKENGTFEKDSLLLVEKNTFISQPIIINGKGEEIFNCSPRIGADNFNEGLCSIYPFSGSVNKGSYINTQGYEIIPQIYDYVMPFTEGVAAVEKDGKWGYINSSGTTVLPFVYEEATMFSDGKAIIKQNGARGVIDKNGNIIIPCEYKNIQLFENYAIVNKDGYNLGYNNDKKYYDYIWKFNDIQKPISVYLNDKKIEFDVPPVIEEGRTLVPLRAIFEAMGMTVGWDGTTSTIIATGKGNSISMRVNETTATVNGKTLTMDVPSKVIDGRTLVPVRFIAESLGAEVEWDGENRIVYIHTKILSDDKIRTLTTTYSSSLPNLKDVTFDFQYSDSFFVPKYSFDNGYGYNHDLLRASLALETASWTPESETTEYTDQNVRPTAQNRMKNILNVYEQMNLSNIEQHNYGKSLYDSSDSAAYSFASKELYDGTTLVTVVIRGAGYGAEWRSDFNLGNGVFHVRFYIPAKEIYDNLEKYMKKYNYSKDTTKIWLTGYSRAGAIGNIVGGMIDDKQLINRNNLYAYLFAVPCGVNLSTVKANDEIYANIKNIILPYDVIPKVVFENWNWGRYGITLTVKNIKSKPTDGNVQYFKNLTNNSIEYEVGPEQTTAATRIANHLSKIIPSQSKYVNTYQSFVMDITEWALFRRYYGEELQQFVINRYGSDQRMDDAMAFFSKEVKPVITGIDITTNILSDNVVISDNDEVFKIIYWGTVLMYMNNISKGEILEFVDSFINEFDGYALLFNPNIVTVTAFNTGDKLFGAINNATTIADAHNSEYYISWMFGYDNPQDIFQDFN